MGKLPDLSPFVTKVETYLRMTQRPYTKAFGDLRKAPHKKLPYIEDGGQVVADSNAIVRYLQTQYGDALDEGQLRAEQRATAAAWKSLFESDLYFVVTYSRWWHDEDFASYRPALQDYCRGLGAPRMVWPFILTAARRGTKAQLIQQGTGRLSRDAIMEKGLALLGAISDFLGDKPFFLGDRPSSLDATAYAFLSGILWAPFEGPLKSFTHGRPNLVAYCERMHKAYWEPSASTATPA